MVACAPRSVNPRSVPRRTVDRLAQQVGVPVVSRVLLDHVQVHPPEVDPPAAPRDAGVVEPVPRGRLTRRRDLGLEHSEVVVGAGRVRGVEVVVRAVLGVEDPRRVLGVDGAPEPAALDVGHVPDEPEQRERRRRHRAAHELLAVEARALGDEGRPVELQPRLERRALGVAERRIGPLGCTPVRHGVTLARGADTAATEGQPADQAYIRAAATAGAPEPPPNRTACASSGKSWCSATRSRHPGASGHSASYPARTAARCGRPNSASIARSVSRWPPWAAGSISTASAPPPAARDHSTLPDHRSPWSRAGRSPGSPVRSGSPASSRAHAASTTRAPFAPSAPRSRAARRYGSTRYRA